MNTYPEINESVLKKQAANKMLENARRMLIDDTVKIEYYEYIASIQEDEKVRAQWLVEADKTKVNKRGLEESVALLEKFVENY